MAKTIPTKEWKEDPEVDKIMFVTKYHKYRPGENYRFKFGDKEEKVTENGEEKTIPTKEYPELDRILFFTKYRVDRNYMIWRLSKSDLKQTDIGKAAGCSQPVVNYTLLRLNALGDDDNIWNYFAMAFDLEDICLDYLKADPDKYVTNIVMSFWKNDVRSKEKIRDLSIPRFRAIMESRGMKRAGNAAVRAAEEYRWRLRNNDQFHYISEKENEDDLQD